MSDLIRRAKKAKTLVGDSSLPKWQRLSQGLHAFAGLELTGIPEHTREGFEADLVAVNRELSRYPLETEEDYQIISDADLQLMLDLVDVAASRAIAAELDRIVNEFDAGDNKLPVDTIQEVREHRDLMVPRLIELLREVTSAARDGDIRDGNAHFFAIFLLTEFKAKEAFPAILEVFSLPGDLPFDLFDDAVTSTFARILAQFAGDRPELLDTLIADRQLNEFVRWEAAQCYLYLVRDGRLQRDEAVLRLQNHLRRTIEKGDEEIIGGLICVLNSFLPKEAIEDIEEAYRLGLVESVLIDIQDVERSIAEGEAWFRKELEHCPDTGIPDTIEELRHWAAFSEEPARRRVPPPHFSASRETNELVPETAPTRSQRIGRNEPCICGSGKKYKKCCGART